MWLLDKMLRRLVKRGELVIIDHDGREYRYGIPDPSLPAVTLRFTDRGTAMHIAKDPGIGAGEAYMDGRLQLERGDIRDLVILVRANADRPSTGFLKPPSPLRRVANEVIG
ncbi:MAG TPA: SAM-dependent methyltransferase, partial [Allosphingosinicella sp.]|nr:SAM-dependent methyltransferase [Allosphingosinicella sp.]